MVSEGKRVYIYGEKEALAPLVTVNTFEGDGHGVYSFLADLTDKKFALAVVSDVNWDVEMSPWECAPVNKNGEPCTGGADKYIKLNASEYPAAIFLNIGDTAEFTYTESDAFELWINAELISE